MNDDIRQGLKWGGIALGAWVGLWLLLSYGGAIFGLIQDPIALVWIVAGLGVLLRVAWPAIGWIIRLIRQPEGPPTSHGSAAWLSPQEVPSFQWDQSPVNGYLVGRHPDGGFLQVDTEGHLMTFSRVGGGKGVSVIMPTCLSYAGPLVVLDPKGEAARICGRRRREMGQRVVYLDPDKRVTSEPDTWNPLDQIDTKEPDTAIERAEQIVRAMLPLDEKGEKHWINAARALVKGVILHVCRSEPIERRNLHRVRQLLRLPLMPIEETLDKENPRYLNDVYAAMRDNPEDCAGLIFEAANVQLSRGDKEAASVTSAANAGFNWLDSLQIRRSISETTFDLRNMPSNTTVFICFPPAKKDVYYIWIRIILETIIDAVISKPKYSMNTLFLLDEFPVVGQMDIMKVAFDVGRGYGVSMWAVLQNMTQLDELYGKGAQTMLGNCKVWQVFALENYDTAEMISRQLGQQTIDITSRGATESGQGWSTSQTTSNTGRALLTPDEVRLVGAHDNQQIVFMSGRRPWKGPRICHFNDSEFTGLWDEDTRPTT